MADDLLTPIVTEDRQHPSFRVLITEKSMVPTCDMLRRIWAAFPNPDGNFIRDFQTAQFDARIWELCLFAAGHYGGKVVSAPGNKVRIQSVKIQTHQDGDKVIPSGFFDLPEAENVSAVIFSNEGTVAKLKRMIFDREKYSYLRMIRVGSCLDFDPRATTPDCFGYLVGDFDEEWGHGMYVFHNPRARHPIPNDFFEGFSGRHWFEDGEYHNLFREFSPYASITYTFMVPEEMENELPAFEQYLRLQVDKMASEWFAASHGDFDYQEWLKKRSQ